MTYNVKKACIFHLILVGISSKLIQFVKGLLTNNFQTSYQDLSTKINPIQDGGSRGGAKRPALLVFPL